MIKYIDMLTGIKYNIVANKIMCGYQAETLWFNMESFIAAIDNCRMRKIISGQPKLMTEKEVSDYQREAEKLRFKEHDNIWIKRMKEFNDLWEGNKNLSKFED